MRIWLAKRLRRLAARLDRQPNHETYIVSLMDTLDLECAEHAERVAELHAKVRTRSQRLRELASGRGK
ncbi:MAG: hypothetical protein GYB50_20395 [Rhodobacteraceae bacterium]|nr:hypothetical protein [Paracoccaceae bacterium]